MVKVNLIVAVCVMTVLATVSLMACLRLGVPGAGHEARDNDRSLLAAGLVFGAIGITVKYLFVVPYTLGLTGEVISGAFLSLSLLAPVALYLLTSWTLASGRAYLPLIVAFAGLEMVIGLLGFNKSEFVFSLMMVVLAGLRSRVTLMRLAGAAAVILPCFQTIVPMAEYGRHQLGLRYNSLQGASLDERWEILANYFDGATVEKAVETQSSIQRLSYMNAAALAIQWYDSGLPGNSLANVLAVFVPRMLWPDKPIITRVGIDFNVLATGNDQSSSAPGLFAESYWNFGWLGIPLLMVPLALIHFYLSRYSLNVIHSGRWLFFPVVLFGMKMGLRVDGHYVADVVGTIVLVVALHVMLTLVDRLVLVIFRHRADSLVRRTA
jgi:hypothetical protein